MVIKQYNTLLIYNNYYNNNNSTSEHSIKLNLYENKYIYLQHKNNQNILKKQKNINF